MSKRNENEAVTVGSEAPSWLVALAETDTSLDSLKKYIRPPRVKIIQSMTKGDLKRNFGEGSAVLMPAQVPLAKLDESFDFVPTFMFTEYCLWSDRRDEHNKMIIDRTFDPGSDLARRSQDKDLRFETYEGGPEDKPFQRRYVEHLNFAGVIYNGDNHLTPCLISFEKGEFGTGTSFCSAVGLRQINGVSVPLYAQVWRLTPAIHTDGKNDWYGFNFGSAERITVHEDEVAGLEKAYTDLKKAHAAKLIVVDRDDDEASTVDLDTSEV